MAAYNMNSSVSDHVVFEAVFDRSSGQNLGIYTAKQEGALFVKRIADGAVALWNIDHYGTPCEVMPGDRIVEVNGVHGDVTKLSSECKKNVELRVKILRPHSQIEEEAEPDAVDAQPLSDKVLSWIAGGFKDLTSDSAKQQVKERAENLIGVTQELAGSLGETTKELAGNLREKAKDLKLPSEEVLAAGAVAANATATAATAAASAVAEVASPYTTTVDDYATYKVQQLLGGSFGEAIRQPGRVHDFPSCKGLIKVVEEGALHHGGAKLLVSRAQLLGGVKDTSYDLRRIRIGANGGGGLVELHDLLAIEREVDLMVKLPPHPHVTKCHAAATENMGREHCRLLLCDPCNMSLANHMRASGGSLPADEVCDVGHQIAQGLQFLHGHGIMSGVVSPNSVLRGIDNVWKIGDLGRSTDVPVPVSEWREAHGGVCNKDEPPEVEAGFAGDASGVVTTAADLWMLGVLMAIAALGKHPFEDSDTSKRIFTPPARLLLEPVRARLCILLQWLLQPNPGSRLESFEAAALLSAIKFTSAEELLQEMPEHVRIRVEDMIDGAARKLATEESPGWALSRLQVALTTGLAPASRPPIQRKETVSDDSHSVSTNDPPSRDEETTDTDSLSDGHQPSSDTEVEGWTAFTSSGPVDLLGTEVQSEDFSRTDNFSGNPFDEDSPFEGKSGTADLIDMSPKVDLIDLDEL